MIPLRLYKENGEYNTCSHYKEEAIWFDNIFNDQGENVYECTFSMALRDTGKHFYVWLKLVNTMLRKDLQLLLNDRDITCNDLIPDKGNEINTNSDEASGIMPAKGGKEEYCWLKAGRIIDPKIFNGNAERLLIKTTMYVEAIFICNGLEPYLPESKEDFERFYYGFTRKSLGSSTLTPDKLVPDGEAVFIAEYRIGAVPIVPGGGIIVGVPWGLFPLPEHESYINNEEFNSIKSGTYPRCGKQPVAQLKVCMGNTELIPQFLPFEKLGLATREYLIKIDLPQGAGQDSVITIELGNEKQSAGCMQCFPYIYKGVEKHVWYTPVTPFRILADPLGNGDYIPIAKENSHTFEVLCGEPERLYAVVPTVNISGSVSPKLIFTDKFNNPVKPEEIDIVQYVPVVRYEYPNDKGKDNNKPVYYPAGNAAQRTMTMVESMTGNMGKRNLKALSNPYFTGKLAGGYNIYWGEIHGHSGESDGLNTVDDYFTYARDVATLDFTSLTDHAEMINDSRWRYIQSKTNDYYEPGHFVTLVGFEWAGIGGHKCVYTSQSSLNIVRATGIDKDGNTTDDILGFFRGIDGSRDGRELLIIPHHTLAVHDWSHHRPEYEKLVEIYSMWGSSEYHNNPLWIRRQPGPSIRDILNTGAYTGFTGGSDSHHARPGFSSDMPGTKSRYANLAFKSGLTAVYSSDLTREGIFNALKERRTYATTGARIIMHFESEGILMGGIIGYRNRLAFNVYIAGTAVINKVQLMSREGVVIEDTPDTVEFGAVWEVEAGSKKDAWYYIRCEQEDGEQAFSSPIWVGGNLR